MTRISTGTVTLHRSGDLFDNLNVPNYRPPVRAAIIPSRESFRNTFAGPQHVPAFGVGQSHVIVIMHRILVVGRSVDVGGVAETFRQVMVAQRMPVEIASIHVPVIEKPLVVVGALSTEIVRLQVGRADVVVIKGQVASALVQVGDIAAVQVAIIGVAIDVVFAGADQKH
ncbi:hypothetical protein TcasGA2_TC005692 [Tribolium castaneum]|uniref:Uncharacterized protein n=1 Tax=Tribolium castaneum TaxID=7070 RepID=D6WWS2_TRICA|nr:hypothetical protein TcasGA2_TC005692 [Tribolium castaneum]